MFCLIMDVTAGNTPARRMALLPERGSGTTVTKDFGAVTRGAAKMVEMPDGDSYRSASEKKC